MLVKKAKENTAGEKKRGPWALDREARRRKTTERSRLAPGLTFWD
jgi:hypothetical protein